MRDQPMAAGEIDDAAAAKPPTRAPRDLPRLEELLAWQAVGAADDATDSIEQGGIGKAPEITRAQPRAARGIEARPHAEGVYSSDARVALE